MSFRPKVTRQQVNKTYYFGHQTIPKKAVVQSTALSLTLSHGVGTRSLLRGETFLADFLCRT